MRATVLLDTILYSSERNLEHFALISGYFFDYHHFFRP